MICENANHKNPSDAEGITPLHLSAKKGLLLMCRSILTYVPEDKNAFDGDGKTPCDLAKGQLISKCLFGAIVLTKKPTIFFKEFLP